jgi:16S rRNA processing protein RimM
MNYIYVGKVVNTHGLKGEVKLISDFEYKNDAFKKDIKLYIGDNKEEVIVNSYRVHQKYDMLTFKEINIIEDVLKYKGESVYINKEDIKINDFFNEDLLGLDVYDKENKLGQIKKIELSKAHRIIYVNDKLRIPYVKEFVEKVDLKSNRIYINVIKGLIQDED